MNKLLLHNDNIVKSNLDEGIKMDFISKNDFFSINSIKFNVYEDVELEIEYESDNDSKLDLFFHIHKNASLKIFEKREGRFIKVQYKFYVDENGSVKSNKIYDSSGTNELCIVNLNGYNASFDMNFKTIATDDEKYTVLVNHNSKKTISNINMSGINLKDGSINVNLTTVVLNGKEDCAVNQNGRIVTFNDNDCIIKPNLIIEEDSTLANHAASIGSFSDDEVFYLMSRGIDYDNSINLLTKGFLLNNLNLSKKHYKEVKKIVDSYWG